MNLDIMTLQCFLAVSSTRSFSKAAEQVNRTQSAVSQQMAKLEQFLGKNLIARGKALTLTPAGEIFEGYARKILQLQIEALDRFREPDLEGEVRFGLPEDFATVFLADVLVDFTRIHPRVGLHMACDLTLNLFDRFKRKEFDLVLVKMNRPQDFPNGLLVWSEKLEWVGHKNLLANWPDQPRLNLPMVLSPQPCVYRSRAIEALEKSMIKWHLVFCSPSYSGMIAAVKAGIGITVLPRAMIPEGLDILHHDKLPNLDDTHVSLLKHDPNNPAICSFERFVLNKLQHQVI